VQSCTVAVMLREWGDGTEMVIVRSLG